MRTQTGCVFLLLALSVATAKAQQTPPARDTVSVTDRATGVLKHSVSMSSETRLSAPAVTVPRTATISRLEEKWFVWPELKAGDCTMLSGARLIMRSDGTTDWSAVTRSSDTNDQWEMKFNVYASNGYLLFIMPFQFGDAWYFHDMPNKDQNYGWTQTRWTFDPTKFPAIDHLTMTYRC